MKKISNWLVGSFFRTIGRFLAIAGIGILFYIIASKSGLKLTDLLGIGRVYAATGSYTNSVWSIRTVNPNLQDCTDTGSNIDGIICANRSYIDNISLGSYYYDNSYLNNSVLISDARFYAYTNSNNKFLKDNLYNFNYKVCQKTNPSVTSLNNAYLYNWSYNTSSTPSGQTFMSPSSASLVITSIPETQVINNITTHCYNYKFSVVPTVDSLFIGFFMRYTQYVDSFVKLDGINNAGNIFSVQTLNIDYQQGTGVVIENSANQIINNQNQNTNDIINNQNQNTQDIIDNQNQNTQDLIDSQRVCQLIDKNNIKEYNKTLNYNGSVNDTTYNVGITDYIKIYGYDLTIHTPVASGIYSCFYNINKTLISCQQMRDLTTLQIPANSYYFRSTINAENDKPVYNLCKDGNSAVSDSINDLNGTLTDDTVNNSDIENGLDLDYDTSQSYGAFSGFLLLPLTWVQQILIPQDSCSSVNLPLPYMENKYLTLPCMNDFWNSLGLLADLISLVWVAVVGVRIFNGLYLLVVDVTSTEDNAEKLDKVRSWEL